MAQRRPVPRGPGQQSPCSWQRLVVGTGRTPTLGGAQKHSHCLWSKLPKIWAEAPVYNPCNFYSTQQTLHGPFRGPGPCGMPTKALLLKSVCITGPKHKPLRARAAGGGATGIGALENHAHKSGGGQGSLAHRCHRGSESSSPKANVPMPSSVSKLYNPRRATPSTSAGWIWTGARVGAHRRPRKLRTTPGKRVTWCPKGRGWRPLEGAWGRTGGGELGGKERLKPTARFQREGV